MPFNENKDEPIAAPDTPNQTTFNIEEVDELTTINGRFSFTSNTGYNTRRDYFKMLRKINENAGGRRGTFRPRNQFYDRVQRMDCISGQLDLSNRQRRIARNMRNAMEVRRLGFDDQTVAFAICILVYRYERFAKNTPEDEREIPSPHRPIREDNPERFLQVQDSLEITDRDLQKVLGKLRHVFSGFCTTNPVDVPECGTRKNPFEYSQDRLDGPVQSGVVDGSDLEEDTQFDD